MVTRLFETDDNDILTLVTAGVGDGIVAVFNLQTHTLKTLIKPRQYDRGTQFTPASITENLAGATLQCVSCPIPGGSVLLRMTDGAWESLPHQCSEPLLDERAQKRYLEYALDETLLGHLLATFTTEYPTATAADYRGYLQNLIQHQVETQKVQLLHQQDSLQRQLKAFHGTANSKLSDFISWASQHNPQFRSQLDGFLKALNIANTDLNRLPLSALEAQLQRVQLGDDITLHVEIVGTTQHPAPRLGM